MPPKMRNVEQPTIVQEPLFVIDEPTSLEAVVYQETSDGLIAELADVSTPHRGVVAAVRSRRQTGRHSPRSADGTVVAEPGTYIPGLGPVRTGNSEAALRKAAVINAGLTEPLRAPVTPVLAPFGGHVPPVEGTPAYEIERKIAIAAEMPAPHDFLPATTREAKHGFALLQPNRDGVVDQKLLSVYRGASKIKRDTYGFGAHVADWYGDRAVASTLHEFHDYRENADNSILALRILEGRLAGRPSVLDSLAAFVTSDQAGTGELVRHIATKLMMAGELDKTQLGFDPFVAREERFHETAVPQDPELAEALAEHKEGDFSFHNLTRPNKQLLDIMTSPHRPKAVTEYIDKVVASLTVGQAQGIVQSAIQTQINRSSYWTGVLTSIRNPDYINFAHKLAKQHDQVAV